MEKIIPKYRPAVVQVISYLYVLLFVYSAVSKFLEFEDFRVQLAQSPLLSAYAGIIAPSIIIIEILIAIILCFRILQLLGLYASFYLMMAFTEYIFLILNFSDFIPCSCGGIIEELGWTEHLVFNIVFILLALVAIVLTEKASHTRPFIVALKMVLPSLAVIGAVAGLFLSSEHIIKKENHFIRRFGQHPIRDEKAFNLGVNSYYFAGYNADRIYLGNVTAPLTLTTIDTALTTLQSVKLQIDNRDHLFRALQIQVQAPWFYLYDGSVPVIYRGLLGDTLARTISYADCYFSQLQVIDSVTFAFRAQSSESKTQVLGRLQLNSEPKVTLNHNLLKKQVDGMFDTDGQLLRDSSTGELVYLFTYRNEILVMDGELNLLRKLHTIDTISRAQVQVRSLSDGRFKLDAPPLMVNKTSAVHGQVLFNASNLMGRYESRKMWDKAVIVDMYLTNQQEYPGSFYVHHREKNKMARMYATDSHLFVMSGSEIVRYRFAQTVTRHFLTGEAENLEQSRR